MIFYDILLRYDRSFFRDKSASIEARAIIYKFFASEKASNEARGGKAEFFWLFLINSITGFAVKFTYLIRPFD